MSGSLSITNIDTMNKYSIQIIIRFINTWWYVSLHLQCHHHRERKAAGGPIETTVGTTVRTEPGLHSDDPENLDRLFHHPFFNPDTFLPNIQSIIKTRRPSKAFVSSFHHSIQYIDQIPIVHSTPSIAIEQTRNRNPLYRNQPDQ